MKKLFNRFMLVYTIIVFTSCGVKTEAAFIGKDFPNKKAYNRSIASEPVAKAEKASNDKTKVLELLSDQHKIIKNANINFKTDDIEKATTFIEELVSNMPAYITNNNAIRSKTRESRYLTIKIACENFDTFLSELSTGIKNFENKEIYSEDVTTQFIDYTSRLNVKKETEKRYLEILNKAKTLTEIIEVEKALNELRSEIESLEGQLNYLNKQVDFSTIYISFYSENVHSKSFLEDIGNAFISGGQLMYTFFLIVINIWPFLLLALLAIFLIRLKCKKK